MKSLDNPYVLLGTRVPERTHSPSSKKKNSKHSHGIYKAHDVGLINPVGIAILYDAQSIVPQASFP